MLSRELTKPQTLEEMVNDLFPKLFLDLSRVPTNLADIDTATLLKLISDVPCTRLRGHFKFANQRKFLNALVSRHIRVSEYEVTRLQTIPKGVFPCLILASKNINHLTEALNVHHEAIGRFIKEEKLIDDRYIKGKRNLTAYSTYKCQLLVEHSLLNPILEEHVNKLGTSVKTIKAIAKTIGCNEEDTYDCVTNSLYWIELKRKEVEPSPIPAAAGPIYSACVSLVEPTQLDEAQLLPTAFSRTQLDDEYPMFEGALMSLSQSTPVADIESFVIPSIDATPQWVEETIACIATTFQLSVAHVKTCLALSTSAQDFRSRMGEHLESVVRRFFEVNNLSYLELKTGKKIYAIRKMIISLCQYANGELTLKNNFHTFARDLGISIATLKIYLKTEHNTSFARIIIEDLTPTCLFSILKTAKGNKPKASMDMIAQKLACSSASFQDSILYYFGINFRELADSLLPAISTENFRAISEKYTQRIGEMTEVQRRELVEELRRLATAAPRISVFSQERTDVENPRPRKAPRT